MDIGIDRGSMEAPWHQLYRQLRDAITSGEIPAGALLPSRSSLQQEHGLAIKTITKAMDALRAEGLVATAPGMGTFAAKPGDS